jgi:hypothetical protein
VKDLHPLPADEAQRAFLARFAWLVEQGSDL